MKSSLRIKLLTTLLILLPCTHLPVHAGNQPNREEWLQDAGFGMFIHWSMDAQLGTVISHSMVGASEDYLNRYIHELPKTFNPTDFDADRMATLAKLAGMKYMVFTTKHHNGFCMWDTETTDFNIMNTPFGRDVVKEYVEACRRHGLQVGIYFSPEDFLFLHENQQVIRRRNIEDIPDSIKVKYIDYVKRQTTELLQNYGHIDVFFFDGKKNFLIDALKPHVWSINQELLITRGEITTPEQYIMSSAQERVWEACMTMGTQWQFKPTNEEYKPTAQIIDVLVRTRARGGALLLNIGPDAYGEIPFEQDRRLRELSAWYFINHEAINNVRPWIVSNEDNIWYTRAKDDSAVYAIIFPEEHWGRGQRKEFTINSVLSTEDTQISVLGQNGRVSEYMDIIPESRFVQTKKGIEISVVRAQRIYNNHRWPNPIVVKLEDVVPNLVPPALKLLDTEIKDQSVTFSAEVIDMGDAENLSAVFHYRERPGNLNALTANEGWIESDEIELDTKGAFSIEISNLDYGVYQFKAILKHPKLDIISEVGQVIHHEQN